MKIGDKIFCPSCADVSGEIGDGIKFCHKCGARMIVLKCNKCGRNIIDNEHRRCGYCGSDPKAVSTNDISRKFEFIEVESVNPKTWDS